MPQIIPAILTDDIKIFEKQLRQVENFTEIVHLDISDGLFTPQKTLTAEEIYAIKTVAKFTAHLMVRDPAQEIERWRNFPNLKRIVFHLETAKIPMARIEHIKAYGWEAGVAVNPETTLAEIGGTGFEANFFLFLAVQPGRQGQKFIPETLDKVKAFKEKYPHTPVGVDGGVHQKELEQLSRLGVDYLVMGSEIFNQSNPGEHLQELQRKVNPS